MQPTDPQPLGGSSSMNPTTPYSLQACHLLTISDLTGLQQSGPDHRVTSEATHHGLLKQSGCMMSTFKVNTTDGTTYLRMMTLKTFEQFNSEPM